MRRAGGQRNAIGAVRVGGAEWARGGAACGGGVVGAGDARLAGGRARHRNKGACGADDGGGGARAGHEAARGGGGARGGVGVGVRSRTTKPGPRLVTLSQPAGRSGFRV